MEQPVEPITTAMLESKLKEAHQTWLYQVGIKMRASEYGEEWSTHRAFCTTAKKYGWWHYSQFDIHHSAEMIWRFTSKPTTEFICIRDKIPIDTIIKVIGKHSGGNDKSNADVMTSSFCRNIGALLGTAASSGGDKNVLKIINQAEYLCGIDIKSLADRGISAHPALHRHISLFETEYVLVSTPGNAAISIGELATVMYPNPFKGLINEDGEVPTHNIDLFMKGPGFSDPLPAVDPDDIKTTIQADGEWVKQVLNTGATLSQWASDQSFSVQGKDGQLNLQAKKAAMSRYLKHRLG